MLRLFYVLQIVLPCLISPPQSQRLVHCRALRAVAYISFAR